MNKLLLLSIGLVIFSCNRTDRESLKDYIEFKVDSENYIRWTKEQNLSLDLFNGKPNNGAPYNCYFGAYFYWDFDEHNEFKFNASSPSRPFIICLHESFSTSTYERPV
jgi:hypothetical protein